MRRSIVGKLFCPESEVGSLTTPTKIPKPIISDAVTRGIINIRFSNLLDDDCTSNKNQRWNAITKIIKAEWPFLNLLSTMKTSFTRIYL